MSRVVSLMQRWLLDTHQVMNYSDMAEWANTRALRDAWGTDQTATFTQHGPLKLLPVGTAERGL